MPYVKTNYAYQRIRDEIFENEDNVHCVSFPVLRKSDDGYDLAVFIDHYTPEELAANQIGRPDHWALADIKSGEIKKMIACVDNDFADGVSDEKVIPAKEDADMDQNYFQTMFHQLDRVRDDLVKTGQLDKTAYQKYVDLMLEEVTPSLADFYRALSAV